MKTFSVFSSSDSSVRDSANDLGRADAPALTRQFVAAARSAHALQNVGAHQRLEQGFEMARRQAEPNSEQLRRDRLRPGVDRNIDDRSKRQNTAPGQEHHASSPRKVVRPVEP